MAFSQQLTDRVVTLRPYRSDDVYGMLAAVQESLPELKPWMSWAHDGYTGQEASDWITVSQARREEKTYFGFAITDSNNEFLGACSLSHIHPVYHFCNLGYWVRTSRRGHGFAGRAARLAARYAFEHVGLIRAEIVVATENKASLRVAEKIGAHYEGILLNRMVVGKAIYDAAMYSLLPSDFGLAARL